LTFQIDYFVSANRKLLAGTDALRVWLTLDTREMAGHRMPQAAVQEFRLFDLATFFGLPTVGAEPATLAGWRPVS
jgi:hypothetical protein